MRLALLFDHFGPYHVARLRAASRWHEVVGVEFHGRSRDYAWEVGEREGLQLRTVAGGGSAPGETRRVFREGLEAVLAESAPDVVAVPGWSSPEALAALNWCVQSGAPAVLMSESTAHDETRAGWKEAVKRRLVGLFSAGFVGGSAHMAYLTELGMRPDRIKLGYDVVDNGHFDRPRNEAAGGGGFLASARFIEKKNLPRLLRAYARYRQIIAAAGADPWPLILLGDGPLRPDLERLVVELGLREAVTLPGFKQYDELPGWYARADAFIHASTVEQWGLVVNEAMASGLPVLVSGRCGCAPDLVRKGKNGLVFDPFEVDDITQAMVTMTKLPAGQREAMGGESRRAIAQWGPDRFGTGLSEAAACAQTAGPRRGAWTDRLLLRLLMNR